MRIGILTFHRAFNCGAMLQAWALKTVLERMGHEIEFPACNDIGYIPRFYIQDIPKTKHGIQWWRSLCGRALLDLKVMGRRTASTILYNAFLRKHLPERRCSPEEFDKYYDLIVVGSDQVWNENLMHPFMPLFLGELLPSSVKRISYAASCGDVIPDGAIWDRLILALSKFDALSVREEGLRSRLEASLRKTVVRTIDPTLLLSPNDYNSLIGRPLVKEPYLYAYVLSGTDYEIWMARTLARKLGVRPVITPVYFDAKKHTSPDVVSKLSPQIMLNYMAHAKYVVASSFHGTAFALLYGKRFLSLRNQNDGHSSRPAELLAQVRAEYRLVNPCVRFDECLERLEQPLDVSVSDRLCSSGKESWEWLCNAVGV